MTANPERGEVDLVVGGQTYILALTTNAICAMEKRTGKPYGDLLAGLVRFSHEHLRELLWAALDRHHGKQFTTIDAVGDLIDEAGGAMLVLGKFKDLGDLNRRKDPDAAKDSAAAHPPDAQASTGDSLRLTLVESA